MQSEYFSSLTPIYHNINLSSVSYFKYFSSPSPIYHRVNQRFFKSKSNDFLKSNCKVHQLCETLGLMNAFGEKFVLVFYNSFLKLELNYMKKLMLLLNTYSFQKKMSSNLKVQ